MSASKMLSRFIWIYFHDAELICDIIEFFASYELFNIGTLIAGSIFDC